MSDALTITEISERFKLPRATVLDFLESGELPFERRLDQCLIREADVHRFLRAHLDRPAVRAAMWTWLNSIAERNPDLNSDDLLEELEQEDELIKAQRRAAS